MIALMFALACGGNAVETTETPTTENVVANGDEAAPDWSHFGAEFATSESDVVQASALFEDPAKYEGKTIRVEGRVADVCQKAGCWMVIAEGEKTMRVLMKDHDFSVAKDGAGSTCQIEGLVESKVVDKATVEHFASESAKPELIPETADEKTYQLVASGVAFKS